MESSAREGLLVSSMGVVHQNLRALLSLTERRERRLPISSLKVKRVNRFNQSCPLNIINIDNVNITVSLIEMAGRSCERGGRN